MYDSFAGSLSLRSSERIDPFFHTEHWITPVIENQMTPVYCSATRGLSRTGTQHR